MIKKNTAKRDKDMCVDARYAHYISNIHGEVWRVYRETSLGGWFGAPPFRHVHNTSRREEKGRRREQTDVGGKLQAAATHKPAMVKASKH